jgi:hypothetical protein
MPWLQSSAGNAYPLRIGHARLRRSVLHVPEESLQRYRHLSELAFLLNRMGGMVSGLGQYDDANKLWAMGGKYKVMANDLRVPGKDGK